MSEQSGYYSVIQYCPDRGREEAANVGVLLYVPASRLVQAKVGPLTDRARKFFGLRPAAAARPNAAAESLAYLVNTGKAFIDSPESLTTFVGSRANDIRLTAPRLVMVGNFVRDLEDLYKELVETMQLQIAVEKIADQPIVPEPLYRAFTRLASQGRLAAAQSVRVPFLEREIDIPYAYRNGVLNLVKPEVFRRASDNRTIQLGAEGQLLQKHPENGERKLIVVAGPGSTDRGESYAGRLLGALGVRFVPRERADEFAQEVEQQAH